MIDTTREFNPECLTRLSGRKYVCGGCAEELGKAVGMVPEAHHLATERIANAEHEIAAALAAELDAAREAQTRVVSADEITDAVSAVVRAELAKQVKKPAAAKPVVPPSK